MTVQDLVNKVNGRAKWYVTGPDMGQCTAIPHEWEQMLGLPIVYGDAKDTWNNAPSDLYIKELNGPTNFPLPGAIMVWNSSWGGGYGHTGVVVSANSNTFSAIEQNNPTGHAPQVLNHNYSGVLGWFYPRKLQQVTNNTGDEMLTPDEATKAYEIVLGREPENAAATQNRNAKDFIFGAAPEIAAQRQATSQQISTLNGTVGTLNAQLTEAQGHVAELQQELDAAKAAPAVTGIDADTKAQVAETNSIVKAIAALLGKVFK